jgi:hypothetical protein
MSASTSATKPTASTGHAPLGRAKLAAAIRQAPRPATTTSTITIGGVRGACGIDERLALDDAVTDLRKAPSRIRDVRTIALWSAAALALMSGCGVAVDAASNAGRALPRAALQRVLRGDGIGGVRFGESPAAVARELGRRFGPPVGAGQIPHGYGHPICGFRPEDWNGLGASSAGLLFVAQLTAWFRHDRFVGYDYGSNSIETGLSAGRGFRPVMLATANGVAVGDPLARARMLYGRALAVTARMQGTPPDSRLMRLPAWVASTGSGPIGGWLGATKLLRGRSESSEYLTGKDTISGINAGATPNTPCKSPTRG